MFTAQVKQSGSSLVETMVSLLLMGVGLLGVLTLQANGLNSNQRAEFVTEAHILAQDMADRIIAYGSASSNGGLGATAGFYDNVTAGKAGTVSTASCSSGCDAGETKAFDQNEWVDAFKKSSLPRASGNVTWVAERNAYTIEVMWDAERTGGTGDVTSCSTSNCLTIEVSLQ